MIMSFFLTNYVTFTSIYFTVSADVYTCKNNVEGTCRKECEGGEEDTKDGCVKNGHTQSLSGALYATMSYDPSIRGVNDNCMVVGTLHNA